MNETIHNNPEEPTRTIAPMARQLLHAGTSILGDVRHQRRIAQIRIPGDPTRKKNHAMGHRYDLMTSLLPDLTE